MMCQWTVHKALLVARYLPLQIVWAWVAMLAVGGAVGADISR